MSRFNPLKRETYTFALRRSIGEISGCVFASAITTYRALFEGTAISQVHFEGVSKYFKVWSTRWRSQVDLIGYKVVFDMRNTSNLKKSFLDVVFGSLQF